MQIYRIFHLRDNIVFFLLSTLLWFAIIIFAMPAFANNSTKSSQGMSLIKALYPNVIGNNLSGLNLKGLHLNNADLSGFNLSGTDLSGNYLIRINLSGADLSNAKLDGAYMGGANLSNAKLFRASLSKADLRGVDLSGASLIGADLSKTDLRETNLSGANLFGVNLSGANLKKVDLSGFSLSIANLSGAYLQRANLSGASMGRVNLSGALMFDTNLSNANMGVANLSGASLIGADLSGANLSNANLSGARLSWINLSEVNLSRANLSGTIFEPKSGALPSLASMSGSDLSLLTYDITPQGLYELREAFSKTGFRRQERQITYAIEHTKRLKLLIDGGVGTLGAVSKYILFELTCQYGMSPARALIILVLLIPFFGISYASALTGMGNDGIWRVWPESRMRKDLGKEEPELLKLTLLKALFFGFYFSFISAFRALNVGSWINSIQFQQYTLKGTGWVRTISGIQTLISAYLLVLWVLTYFGKPFQG